MGSSPLVSTKKEVTFVYQKLLLFLASLGVEINPRFYRGRKKWEAKIKCVSVMQAQGGKLMVYGFSIGPFVQRGLRRRAVGDCQYTKPYKLQSLSHFVTAPFTGGSRMSHPFTGSGAL